MRLVCPAGCGADNDTAAEHCAHCGAPLRNHARLVDHAAHLFNSGLAAARAGELGKARELFAAVVHWAPRDRDARNALALACFQLGDHEQARFHWNAVLAQRPQDTFAATGLRKIENRERSRARVAGQRARQHGRRHRRRRSPR